MEQRRTVLLADTSTEFRILLREAMEKTGEFWVDVAQTGDEVLEKVQEQEPDILIMDVILPGLDGLSALRELQELGYAPMTILTSAFVSRRWRKQRSWALPIFCQNPFGWTRCWTGCGTCSGKSRKPPAPL